MNISLAPEVVATLGSFHVTNSMLAALIISAALLLFGLIVRLTLAPNPGKNQSGLELIFTALLDITEKVVGRADVAAELFPFIITAFLFIVISNWFGLIPGISSIGFHSNGNIIPLLRAPTTDLNMVGSLAVVSVLYVQYLAVKYTGIKAYLHKFFDFSSPIYFFVGLIELVSEFTRIISYSFRLFGNIFAGEVLIAVMFYLTTSLLPVFPILPLPFFFLELFVGFIQAFVFCFLTIAFTAIAVANHGPTEHVAALEPLHS